MRKNFLAALFIITSSVAAIAQTSTPMNEDFGAAKEADKYQSKFGFKAGYNIAKLTGKAANFSPDVKNGFTVAAFYAPASRGGLGYRSEIVFSRQGFGFDENGKTSSISNDYIYLPQFTTFGITKFVQLQVGGQIGYLLKSSKEGTSETKSEDITSFANRLDYGAALGAEIYPVKGLIIGGRYNFSLGDIYKQQSISTSPIPNPLPFNPSEVKGKNAVINFFIGFQF